MPEFEPGSLLSEAVPAYEITDDSIKMVIYGENRCGKTTLACKFPKPLLLISLEPNKTGGALSIRKIPGVMVQKIHHDPHRKHVRNRNDPTGSDKFVRVAAELRQKNPYETVVIDSATSLQDIILAELMNLSEVPEQLNWGKVSRDVYRERSEKTRECLRPYLNLDCHVVVTAKQRDHNPQERDKPAIIRKEQIESFFAADLGGATVGWLHDACDYICQLAMHKETTVRRIEGAGGKVVEELAETGRNIRRLRTMLHPNYAAGFRSDTPENVPEFIDEPTYEKIAAVIGGVRLPDAK